MDVFSKKGKSWWGEQFLEEFILSSKGRKLIKSLLIVAFAAEIAALFVDLCQEDYWWTWLDKIFTYEISGVIPVVAIAWGAVSIPMSFLLGQIERRSYGIRLVDFLIASWGMAGSILLILSFCVQLAFILLATTYELPVLFTVVAWTQILYVVLAFYMVGLSLSHKAVQNIIKEQSMVICNDSKRQSDWIDICIKYKSTQELKKSMDIFLKEYSDTMQRYHWLLKDMIKNLSYTRIEDVDSLENILRDDVCPKLQGIVGRKMVYELFGMMLSVADQGAVNRITADIFCEEIGEDARKGILGALISERNQNSYKHCIILLEKLNDIVDDKKELLELYRWGILWCKHQHIFSMEPEEIIQNTILVSQIQNLMKQECGPVEKCEETKFNDLVWGSCLDIMFLENVDDIGRIIDNLFNDKLDFL